MASVPFFIKKIESILDDLDGILDEKIDIEISQASGSYHVSIFSKKCTSTISEYVYSGSDIEITSALMKSLMEMVERIAQERLDAYSFDKVSSCGFAAYPVLNCKSEAREKVRKISFREAVERYVWKHWWNDDSTKYEMIKNDPKVLSDPFMLEIGQMHNVSDVFEVRPLHSEKGVLVLLYYIKIEGKGFITGGAAGEDSETESVRERALSEALRHSLSLTREKSKQEPLTLYEKKLEFISSLKGQQIFQDRIKKRGEKIINLPKLKFDSEIKILPSENWVIHRSLFEDQEVFLSSELEEFCI